MSCVAEPNAISQKSAIDHWNIAGIGMVIATPASPAPITSCMSHVQRRRVPSRSTTGDQNGLITHGR